MSHLPFKIAFDVDDTLFNFRDPCARTLNALTGKTLSPKDWVGYNLLELYGITYPVYFDAMVDGRALEDNVPDTGVPELFEWLRTIGPERIVVQLATHRGWHPNAGSITRSAMAQHLSGVDYDLFTLQRGTPKSRIWSRTSAPDVMFDDSVDVYTDMKHNHPSTLTYLVTQNHNSHVPNLERVANMVAGLALIKELLYEHECTQGADYD